MRRILLFSGVALLACVAATAQDSAVGIYVVLQNDVPVSLDVSFPATATMETIQYDMTQAGNWGGWRSQGEPAETRGSTISVHAEIQGAESVQSILSDVVWPLVGAMARYQRIAIVVTGAPVAAAPLQIENRFVRLTHSGGQSYDATIKDASFRTLDELKQPDFPDSAGADGRRRGSNVVLRWFLVVFASILTGIAVYFAVTVMMRRR